MEEEQKEESQDKASDPGKPSATIGNEDVKTNAKEEKSQEETHNVASPQNTPINIIIPEDKRKESKQPLIANIIASIAVLVSGLLFIYTYRLFQATKAATDIADSAFVEVKKNDSLASIKDSISFSHDSISLKEQSDLVKAQIGVLNETKREYKANHEPLLDFERTIKDSIGELVIVNKGLGIAHIVSVEYIKGTKLGRCWSFLETIFSPSNMVSNFGSIGASLRPLSRGSIYIAKNVAGFEYFGQVYNDQLFNGDEYYCNKLINTFMLPSETKTLFRVKSTFFVGQMLPYLFKIKYVDPFSDTLVLSITQYKDGN